MSKTEKISPTAPSNQPDARRRALLKGAIKGVAIGTPTIITLASGNAWAQSVPCFNRTYSGFYVVNNQVYKAQPANAQNRVPVNQISQMCWDSGGPQPFNTLV